MALHRLVFRSIIFLGDFSLFCYDTFRALPRLWKRRGLFYKQCEFIGVSSTGIIVTAGMFMGSVLGYQLFVMLNYVGAEELLGGSVGVALFRELAPVMGAIMVTGRAGAAMAAQLASMRISEQIDALEVMAVDPFEYLVAPRVLAAFLMVPLLAVTFGAVGTLASAMIACGVMGLSYAAYWDMYANYVDAIELTHCVSKGLVFGLIMSLVACFFGFQARGGARAVGLATRTTVVVSCLSVLLFDYLLTSLLPLGLAYFIL